MARVKLESPTPRRRVRVMLSLSTPSRGIDYIGELRKSSTAEVEYVNFSWPGVLRGDFDVLHMHWPEFWIRNSNPVKSAAQHVLFPLMLIRLRLGRKPIVRTLHNLTPHEQGGIAERSLLRWMDRWTEFRIAINEATPEPRVGDWAMILHGDFYAYRDLLASPVPVSARSVLFFGHVRHYKGVDRLIRAFRSLPDQAATLTVAGSVKSPALERELRGLSEDDPRVKLDLTFIEDATLAELVAGASLVTLPYSDLHNSGAVFVALSLGRPVLVPRSPSTEALAEEVGSAWVLLYDGDLSPEVLEAAMKSAETLLTSGTPPPSLRRRSWPAIAEDHYRTYAYAIEQTRSSARKD